MTADTPRPPNSLERAMGGLTQMVTDIFTAEMSKMEKNSHGAFLGAVLSKNIEAVEAQLQAGANPNQFSTTGECALHMAARHNDGTMIDLLLRYGADPLQKTMNDAAETPVETATRAGSPQALAQLLAAGAPPEVQEGNRQLIHCICEENKPALLPALLEAGIDPNEKTSFGATPLLIAVMRSHTALANQLLDVPEVAQEINLHAFDNDTAGRKAFQIAVERRQHGLVEKMIEKGAHLNAPDNEGVTPLHMAIQTGDTDMMRLLLENGNADVNRAPDQGVPPLFAALAYSAKGKREAKAAEMVDLLMRYGADPDLRDEASGQTALHLALEHSGTEGMLIRTMMRYAQHIEQPDNAGRTPLFAALARRTVALLQAVVEGGADVNERRPHDGATPLIAAVRSRNFVQAEWLVNHGANITLADRTGKTAYDYAQEGQDKLLQMLFKTPPATRALPPPLADTKPLPPSSFKGPR